MKEKIRNILFIGLAFVIVSTGILFATGKNFAKKGFSKAIHEEETVYNDTVLMESAPARSSNTMLMKSTSAGGTSTNVMQNSNNSIGKTQEQKIIKSGSLDFEVKNLSEIENKIAEWLKGFDGYISNTWTNRNRLTITAKVPANRFEEAMNSTGNFGILNSRSISTDDVTENFYDLETRLNTRKILQQKLSGYLKDAKNISDLLEIERQLNNVTSEIESMEKQFRRLSNQIEFSTISISCTLPPNTTDTGFITPDFSEDFKDFAYNALQFISDFGICILYILVIGIPLVLLIAVLYWVCFGKIGLIRKLFDKLKP